MFFTPTAFYKITIPPGNLPERSLTKVITAQCGQTLSSIFDIVYAIPVFRATTYEFEVTVPDFGTFIASESGSAFDLYNRTPGNATYNTAYTIRVRSKGNATLFTAYGDPCVVTTPAS
jgi:hypothetical protein